LQAFTGSAGSASLGVTDLGEVTYFKAAGSTVNYAGWEQGSKIGFYAESGSTYYIRVDSVQSGSQWQGDFNISYSGYHNTTLNSCSQCPPFLDDGRICVGQVFLANAGFVSPTVMSYGTINTGSYVWQYCKGCVCYGDGTLSQGNLAWSVYQEEPASMVLPGNGPSFWIHYQSGSVQASASLGNRPANSGSAFPSQTTCEDAFQCAQTPIVHTGGTVFVVYEDTPTSDNTVVANPPPSFGLYLLAPDLSAGTACASWTTVGSVAQCVFNVENNNAGYWTNVTASLTGSSISASTTATFDILPDADTPITLAFSCSTYGQNVVLSLDAGQWDDTISFPYFLNPLITSSLFANEGFGGTCSGIREYLIIAELYNVGNWTVSDAVLEASMTNGLQFLTAPLPAFPPCQVVNNFTSSTLFNQTCNGSSAARSLTTFDVKAPSVATPTTFTANYVTNNETLLTLTLNTTINT
jgi:hypothetical protein